MEAAERLNSWKEIAAYLDVSVRTAQRWETAEQLPARRHKHAAMSSVFAFRGELDGWWSSRPDLQRARQEHPAAATSIAVLPFVNVNRDEETEILGDGLTEELINALARVDGLQVVARTSVFHFKGQTGDVRDVGARLGVGTILEGSVRRAGERLRITAQLISVADGCHLWSERFDRRMTDLFDLEEEIARAIVEALRVKLAAPRLTGQYCRDIETYSLYLEGRYHWSRRTRAGFQQAVECFERALARDDRMALAWAGLADCYAVAGYLAGIPGEEAARRGKAAALKALEIDSSLAEANIALAFITAAIEYDWPGGQKQFRRALELNPAHPYAHLLYAASVLAPLGQLAEAELHTKRACELDPFSAVMSSALGVHFLGCRQFDRAISASKRALELDPGHPWAHRSLGEAFLMKNMFDEAAAEFLTIEAPVFAAGLLGYCYTRNGHEADARQLLGELERAGSPSLAYQMAVLHLGLRDHDAAFARLDAAREARCLGIHWLRTDPIWDEVRPDPRFGAVLEKMGLGER